MLPLHFEAKKVQSSNIDKLCNFLLNSLENRIIFLKSSWLVNNNCKKLRLHDIQFKKIDNKA